MVKRLVIWTETRHLCEIKIETEIEIEIEAGTNHHRDTENLLDSKPTTQNPVYTLCSNSTAV